MAVSGERIRREVWAGCVPVEFALSPRTLQPDVAARPLYLLVGRVLYFPLIADQLRRHFSQYYTAAQTELGDMWLEVGKGTPGKWHVPVGVLFDCHGPTTGEPWRVHVHFDAMPQNRMCVLRSGDEFGKTVERTYFNVLKEAVHLKFGSVEQVMALSKEDQTQLWDGVRDFNYDLFWQVNQQLQTAREHKLRNVPMRIHLADEPTVQQPVEPGSDDAPRTIGDVLASLVPHVVDPVPVVHGVRVGLETPVLWLAEHMIHPDNFVHAYVRAGASA